MKEVLELAKNEIGTWEWADGHNPVVLAYFKDAGHPGILDDETAWCAAFVGAMLKRSGYKPTGSLLARSYTDWGEEVSREDIQPGDIVVIPRGNSSWQGHVFFFAGWNNDGTMKGLGGNQSNQVNVKSFSPRKILAIRRGKPMRKSILQSTEVQTIGGIGGSVAGGAATVLSALEPGIERYMVLGFCGVIALGLLYLYIKRSSRWEGGDR